MNINNEQLNEEKKHLKTTLRALQEILEQENIEVNRKVEAINAMKRYIWENNAELDDVEIAQGMYGVNCDVGSASEKYKKIWRLQKSLKSAYFGRIDFVEDNDEPFNIYIGINGINQGLKYYVFDWRTPIASMFYNYGLGAASYEAPAGEITGDIVLRRQFKIDGEEIVRCFDSDLNIDDEYLQEILSKSSSDKMTNIVNTIQREQNAIIRNVDDKVLIVQGVAGSGKTSVALHRIAYLLYREKNLKSNNVLIFSPNDIFSEYISSVLPELGEDNVLTTTFSEFAEAFLKKFKKIETFTEFIERYYKSSEISQEEFRVIKYKLSDEYKTFLDNQLIKLIDRISFKSDIKYNNVTFSREELNIIFKNQYSKFPLFERFNYLTEHICDILGVSYKRNGKAIREDLIRRLQCDFDIVDFYNSIINSDDFRTRSGVNNSSVVTKNNLKFEDIAPLLYVYFELNGYPIQPTLKHIIIDEAQDYNLLQMTMLKKIFGNASFTILGDINQTINPYYRYESMSEINDVFGNNGRFIELNKTYRSSEEIIEYSNKILNLNNVSAIRNSNSVPVLFRSTQKENLIEQIVQDIDYMKKIGMKKIAIITKNGEEMIDLYSNLKEQVENIVILDEPEEIDGNELVIIPSYMSKGLEFDGVIAYTEPEHRYQEKDRYLFYVVCTRAQHSLIVYNQKPLQRERKNNG